ncbi:Protein SGT1-like A [Vitis vinifera]|uniref:Protein SGT1 homolog n=1 Tax=Vitis vinifera TaxID=29760 RepID=A0A438J5H6_VITVI|nr:Protein SGT1-like A [Vitis vinifera]
MVIVTVVNTVGITLGGSNDSVGAGGGSAGVMRTSCGTILMYRSPLYIGGVENASITVGRGASTASAKPKYRHEYYQKPEEVVVTIFAKGIPENNVVVHFAVQTLSVAIEVPGVTPYYLHLRLFGKIIPDNSRYAVMSTKVEIRLAKAEALNWPSLEISDKGTDPKKLQMPSVCLPIMILGAVDQRPTNPSSKAKVIDWDKLQAQIEEEEKEEELKDDATTDADTQRTMNKKTCEPHLSPYP